MNPYKIHRCTGTDLFLVIQKRWWLDKCLSAWDTRAEAKAEVKRLINDGEYPTQ